MNESEFTKFLKYTEEQLPSLIQSKEGATYYLKQLLSEAYTMGLRDSKLMLYTQVNTTLSALFDSNSVVYIENYDEVKS